MFLVVLGASAWLQFVNGQLSWLVFLTMLCLFVIFVSKYVNICPEKPYWGVVNFAICCYLVLFKVVEVISEQITMTNQKLSWKFNSYVPKASPVSPSLIP